MTLNGTILVGSGDGSIYGEVHFANTGSLSGSGSILFGSSAFNTVGVANSANKLTIGAGVTIHGKSGTVGTAPTNGGGMFINQGTISADVAGGTLTLDGTSWSSSGVIQEIAGTTVNLRGSWSNTGSLSIGAGTLNLGGSFTTSGSGIFAPAQAGNFSRSGGTVNVTGTLDNTGSTLALDDRTGLWNLISGTIRNGIITTAGSNVLASSSFNGGGILDGVTLSGTLDVANNLSGNLFASVNVLNGMTLNGAILAGSGDASIYGEVHFANTESLTGSGSILFGGSAFNSVSIANSANTLTIGTGVTIHGKNGLVGTAPTNGGGKFINQGTISADVAGGSITLAGTSWSSAERSKRPPEQPSISRGSGRILAA